MPEWISLNGCNSCINSNVCNELGNCVLLSVDSLYPVNNKKKRRVIQRIRTSPPGHSRELYIKPTPVRLRVFERMAIQELTKPRP